MYYHPKCKRKWVNILNRARNISVSLRRRRDISITVIYQTMSLTVLYMCTYRTIQYMYFYMTSHQYIQDFVCLLVNFSCCYKGPCVLLSSLCLLSLMIDHKLITEITWSIGSRQNQMLQQCYLHAWSFILVHDIHSYKENQHVYFLREI